MSNSYLRVLNSTPDIPLIGNIPHSAIRIPQEFACAFSQPPDALRKEVLRMTDHYTDELFGGIAASGGALLVSECSRLVLDIERYEDDSLEIMTCKGMGAIYTKDSQGNELRSAPSNSERNDLLDKIYRPYHETLLQLVKNCLVRFGTCTIVDCHSFPSKPLPYELDQSSDRPDICIGTDPFHTPSSFCTLLAAAAQRLSWTTAIDRPFSGAITPIPLYKDPRLHSVMIEVNRRLYMDEETGIKLPCFPEICQGISALSRALQ